MDAKEIAELKAGIKKARRRPMNFAYAPNINKGEDDVMMMHHMVQPKMLKQKVKTQTKNPQVAWGSVTIEGKEFRLQYVDKPPTQTILKKLKKFVKDNVNLQFKYSLIDPNGKVSATDDDEEDEHLAADNDDHSHGGKENTAQEGGTSGDEQGEDIALKERLKAAVAAAAKRAQGVMGQEKDLDTRIKEQLKAAQDAANRLNEAETKEAIKALLETIATPITSQTADPKEVAAAFKALQVQRANIETNLGNLINTMSNHADPRIKLIAAKGPSSTITGKSGILKGFLDVVLADLKTWNSAAPDKKEAAAKKLSSSISALMTYVNSSDLVNLLENNPLGINVSIKKPLSAALKELESKIAA